MAFENVNDVHRDLDVNGNPSAWLTVHGYLIKANAEQEERIRRLTVEQRMELLIKLSVLPTTERPLRRGQRD